MKDRGWFALGCQLLLLPVLIRSLPACAGERVTAEQLERFLAADHGKADRVVAQDVAGLELTERLSTTRRARCDANLPGPKARQMLTALADSSAFRDLPPNELPSLARPDAEEQRKMVAMAVDYVLKTIHQLPNLFATRVTTSFQDTATYGELDAHSEPGETKAFHVIGRYVGTVSYRKGQEVVHAAEASQPEIQGLTTSGEFGPILNTVLLDAAQGKLAWSHWEQSEDGPRAVFRFAVAAAKSHYDVSYCCLTRIDGGRVYFKQLSGYDGEITMDPSTGAIVRLSMKATTLKPSDPIVRADLVVEYGRVELDGKTYICPLKGVALSTASEARSMSRGQTEDERRPLRTSLNDVSFEQYHLYGASTRMLPGYKEVP